MHSPANKSETIFPGEIGRLIIIAGHSGSGKTSFLTNVDSYIEPNILPAHLGDFSTHAASHIDIMKLPQSKVKRFETLCLHVDISQPARWKTPPPKTRDELLQNLNPSMFADWAALNSYLHRAEQLDIIIYFVQREIHFSRWMYDKSFSKNDAAMQKAKGNQHQGGSVLQVISALFGDSSNGSELHRHVYKAWLEYIKPFDPRSISVVDANTENYHLMEPSRFPLLLEEGYT